MTSSQVLSFIYCGLQRVNAMETDSHMLEASFSEDDVSAFVVNDHFNGLQSASLLPGDVS